VCPSGEVEVLLAEGFRLRLLGLMRLGAEELEPLLFESCRSIHTFGMSCALDVVWLAIEGNRGRVVEVVEALEPRRHASAPRAVAAPPGALARRAAVARRAIAALELPPGEARRLGIATPTAEVVISPAGPGR
jgi:uncharacterized membrane protein (UPF0127 family)